VLARDHLFEPFLEWVNEKLSKADVIALYAPSRGWTHAELQTANRQGGDEPDIRIPVRVTTAA